MYLREYPKSPQAEEVRKAITSLQGTLEAQLRKKQ
jgi:hypothetical protein